MEERDRERDMERGTDRDRDRDRDRRCRAEPRRRRIQAAPSSDSGVAESTAARRRAVPTASRLGACVKKEVGVGEGGGEGEGGNESLSKSRGEKVGELECPALGAAQSGTESGGAESRE